MLGPCKQGNGSRRELALCHINAKEVVKKGNASWWYNRLGACPIGQSRSF